MSTPIENILDPDGLAEYRAAEFKLESPGAPIAEIYQGPDFKTPKAFKVGDKVIDLTFNRTCTVIKRYTYSVRLSWTDTKGRTHSYGQSLHQLRRVV